MRVPSRRQQLFLTGFFLAFIFGIPLTQAGVEIYRGRWPQCFDIFTRPPVEQNLRSFEGELERLSVASQALRPRIQYGWFTLGNPGHKAVVGKDGWLFYRPDVRYLLEPLDGGSNPLAAILNFRDQLLRRGIHLVVLPVPGKPSVYPDRLRREAAAGRGLMDGHTQQLISALRSAGVETIDLLDYFLHLRDGENLPHDAYYLRRDTHWSAQAARRAAEIVADRIKKLGWAPENRTAYLTRRIAVQRNGDVLRMINIPQLERKYPPETILCDQVLEKDTGALYKDDPNSPVLVLGDSFLRMYQKDEPLAAGFVAHLARSLGSPVASIVNDGGASTLVRQELARKREMLDGKKLVVWEFVERDIRFGAEGWKLVSLSR
ncbi:MAG TPA: hypothetical protein VL285_01565 [Bryobacteraceae bacterium]|nr:hypothetical protein [Bryobacteraceae bacterium]